MTNSEAAQILRIARLHVLWKDLPGDIDAAFYKAIEVLENDPIRRQDAIDAIYDGTPPEPHYPAWYVERIREIPAVKAEEQEDIE